MLSIKELRRKRKQSEHSIAIVADTLGRTRAWLSAVELGRIAVTDQTLARIDEAIERLSALKQSARESRDLTDLRLPRAKNRRNWTERFAGNEK